MKKLTRNRDDKWVSGVIGGISRHYDIDPVIPRLIFILVLLGTGVFPGVVVYLVAIIVVPKEEGVAASTVDADFTVTDTPAPERDADRSV